MIYAFLILALICVALIGLCMRLLGQLDTQAKGYARERGTLLQRIQAPDAAVEEHTRAEAPPKERRRAVVVPLDDDQAMNDALEGKSHGAA